MDVAERLPLDANPFAAAAGAGARVGRPLQAAVGEIIRHIAHETPLILIAGSAGTGKTLLAGMVARACTGMGLSVLQIERGDLVHAPGQRTDLLVIDEADSLPDGTLSMLTASNGEQAAMTIVLLCLPVSLARLAPLSPRAAILTLPPLTAADARAYLDERAAACRRPELFAPGALHLLVEGSRGLPRVLRSLASLAYFNAAMEGAFQIGARHVADALESQLPTEPPHKVEVPVSPTPHLAADLPAPQHDADTSPATEAMRPARAGRGRSRNGWFPHVVAGTAALVGLAAIGAVLTPVLRGVPETAVASQGSEPQRAVVLPVPREPDLASTAAAPRDPPKPVPAIRNLAESVQTTGNADAAPAETAAAREQSGEDADRAARDAADARVARDADARTARDAAERAATAAAYALAARDAAERAATAAAYARAATERQRAAASNSAGPVAATQVPPLEPPEEIAVAPIRPVEATQEAESATIAGDRAGRAKEEAQKSEGETDLAAPQGSGRSPMRILFDNVLRFTGISGR